MKTPHRQCSLLTAGQLHAAPRAVRASADNTCHTWGSANGTFVNKARLKRGVPRQLRNGDMVSLVVASQNSRECTSSPTPACTVACSFDRDGGLA